MNSTSLNKIAVFCGSSSGENSIYTEKTQRLGELFAQQNKTLVYGAGNVGLMGVLADTCLEKGAKVIGVIPSFLKEKEVAHTGITELIVTETMHQRKQVMTDLSDAIIVLPGGLGTMDEFFEIFTWQQLGLHRKPIGLLNVNGYYNHLLQLLASMTREQFLKPYHQERIIVEEAPTELLLKMEHQQVEYVDKWINKK